jgi:hypothetical protein
MLPYTPSHLTFLTHPMTPVFSRTAHLPWPISWAHMSGGHWRQDYLKSAEWFISRALPEPHSPKAIEDSIGWALETGTETLIASLAHGQFLRGRRTLAQLAETATPGVRRGRRHRFRVSMAPPGRTPLTYKRTALVAMLTFLEIDARAASSAVLRMARLCTGVMSHEG